MLKITRSLGVSASLALSASSLFAASYVGSAYEGFDYTASTSITAALAGGTGWNATGDAGSANTTTWATGPAAAGTRTIATSGLDYSGPGYGAETGLAAFIPGGGSVGRVIGQTVDSGTFYFSFLAQKTVDQVRTVNFSFFSQTAPTTFQERLAIGQIANNTTLLLPNGSADPDAATKANQGQFAVLVSNSQGGVGANGVYTSASPISFSLNSTFLVVGKIEFNFAEGGGAADRISLFINPSSLVEEGLNTPYLQISNNDIGSLAALRVFAGSTSGGFTASAANFDEIRLGNSFGSVVGAIPEPSAYAGIAGACGLLLAALRRRRRA